MPNCWPVWNHGKQWSLATGIYLKKPPGCVNTRALNLTSSLTYLGFKPNLVNVRNKCLNNRKMQVHLSSALPFFDRFVMCKYGDLYLYGVKFSTDICLLMVPYFILVFCDNALNGSYVKRLSSLKEWIIDLTTFSMHWLHVQRGEVTNHALNFEAFLAIVTLNRSK